MEKYHVAKVSVLVLLLIGVTVCATKAASLTINTDTTETGTQSYDSLLITNAATYLVTGGAANVSITNTTMNVGKSGSSGSIGNLVVSNGAVFSLTGTNEAAVISPNSISTSTVSVAGGTFGSTKSLVIGGTSSQPGQLQATDGATVTLAGATVQSGYMLISDGSHVTSTNGTIRLAIDSANATGLLDVIGSGTTLVVSNSTFTLARQSQARGILNIRDGAIVSNIATGAASVIGDPTTGGTLGGNTGVVTVANGGQWINSGSFNLGASGTKGGIGLMTVEGPGSYVSGIQVTLAAPSGYGSSLAISNGGAMRLSSQVSVSTGSTILVSSGGILEPGSIYTIIGSGSISNTGGIYEFNTPNVTLNTDKKMVLTDGTISFRNRSDADVTLSNTSSHVVWGTNITYNGENTFRLNSASNIGPASATQNYTFGAGLGASNFVNLSLVNNGNWRSDWLKVGNGGTLLVSNSTASSVNAVVTNQGAIHVVNSVVTYTKPVVLQGSYISDPSTNIFNDNVTVLPGGSLAGGAGDRFEFQESLFVSNTVPSSSFDLSGSTVAFTGGGLHTNSLSGFDYGHTNNLGLPDGFTAGNFMYGRLTLGSTNDQIQFLGGNGAPSNALYVGWLDLGGFTNQFATVSNMVTSLLFAPSDINIYYAVSSWNPNNAYLNDLTYQLTGGGFLMPAIPEPGTLSLLTLAACALYRRVRRNG